MTKAEAFEILSKRIDDMCIAGMIYDCPKKERADMEWTMVATLSDIQATNDALKQILQIGE